MSGALRRLKTYKTCSKRPADCSAGNGKPLAATVEISKRRHEGSPPGAVGFKRVRRIAPVALTSFPDTKSEPATAAEGPKESSLTRVADADDSEALEPLPQQTERRESGEEVQTSFQQRSVPSIAEMAAAAGRAAALQATDVNN